MPIADRLFTNASFRTLDPTASTAEALASWRGRIVAVGSRADVDALVGPGTEVVDLEASTVLPRFRSWRVRCLSSAMIESSKPHALMGSSAGKAAAAFRRTSTTSSMDRQSG